MIYKVVTHNAEHIPPTRVRWFTCSTSARTSAMHNAMQAGLPYHRLGAEESVSTISLKAVSQSDAEQLLGAPAGVFGLDALADALDKLAIKDAQATAKQIADDAKRATTSDDDEVPF